MSHCGHGWHFEEIARDLAMRGYAAASFAARTFSTRVTA
jgi:hypothetical protein